MKGKHKLLSLVVFALASLILAACGEATATPTNLTGPNNSITPANTVAPVNTPAGERVNIGGVAPDFTLTTPDGQTVKLSQFRGKPVLINFWGTWCPPCEAELPLLVQTYQANQDKLVILGVNMREGAGVVEAKVKAVGITYPVVLDTNNDVTNRYKVIAYPTSLFLDKNGVIQRITVGQLTEDGISSSLQRIFSVK